MQNRKPLQKNEWMLFLAPVLFFGLAFMARPMRQKLFPVPVPTPVPTPTPTPIPVLWNTRYYCNYGSVARILASADGQTIHMAGERENHPAVISTWDAKTGRKLRVFAGVGKRRPPQSGVFQWHSYALSDDGARLASTWDKVGSAPRTGIYDTTTGKRLRFVSQGDERAEPVFQPLSHTIAVTFNGQFEIWNTDTGKLQKRVPWRNRKATSNLLRSPTYSRDAQRLAVIHTEDSEMGNYFYANGGRDEIGIYSTRTWRRNRTISWPKTEIRAIGFVGNGQTLVVNSTRVLWARSKTGNNDFYPLSTVRLIDAKSGREKVVRQLQVWRPYEHDLAISPDGRFFAIADSFSISRSVGHRSLVTEKETTFIEIREAPTGRKIASLRILGVSMSTVQSMAFAPDNSTLYYLHDHHMKRWSKTHWKIGHTAKQLSDSG